MNVNVKYSDFLPIGTIVKLKDGVKEIMITGFCPIDSNKKNMYDYSACLYPEGVISSEFNLLFNHNQIEEIIFKGYESNLDKEFKLKLDEIMKKNKEKMLDVLNGKNTESTAQGTNQPSNPTAFGMPMQPQAQPTSNINNLLFDSNNNNNPNA